MLFCTFCGLAHDEKCVKRTQVYPHAAIDPAVGRPTLRGPICRVCTHKFFVHKRVAKVNDQIKVTRINMVEGLKNLAKDGAVAKQDVHSVDNTNQYTLVRIQEAEHENQKMF